ncbi:unnamed protein product [Arctogadus glacialis]
MSPPSDQCSRRFGGVTQWFFLFYFLGGHGSSTWKEGVQSVLGELGAKRVCVSGNEDDDDEDENDYYTYTHTYYTPTHTCTHTHAPITPPPPPCPRNLYRNIKKLRTDRIGRHDFFFFIEGYFFSVFIFVFVFFGMLTLIT